MRMPTRSTVRHALARAVCLLLCLVLAASLTPVSAASSGERVRVGFFAFDGYHMTDEGGGMSGYGYDIIQYMSGYTPLQFDFVGYEASWNEAQDMLENGEIDVLTSAQKTPERLERFDYSDLPIGESAAILTVKAGNTSYTFDDYAHWDGMKVGMISGNSRNASFAQFAAEHGFDYSALYYTTTEKMLAALARGDEIDAVVTSNLRRTDGEWILAQFDASPFYIIVKKGNSELLAEINSALAQLYAAMPDIDRLLMSKYYTTDDGDNVAFTVEEREVIDASMTNPVKIGVITTTKPGCYIDEKTGDYAGISMDILRSVANKTGLRFEFAPIDLEGNAPVGWLREGEFDLVAGILKTENFINDSSLVLSEGIIADSIVMIGRSGDDFTDDPATRVIALSAGFQVGSEFVASQFPEHRTVTFDTYEECLNAVNTGAADAMVYVRTTASYTLQDPHYERLEIVSAFGKDVFTCAAGLAPESKMLVSVINKGLAMISDSERNAIMLNYTILNPYQLSFEDTLYKFRVPICIIAALLLLVVAALIVIIEMRRRTENKLRAAYEQAKDALALAEGANASKSQFLSRVSHEMRTPLNAIIGFMELAKEASDAEMQTYLSNANVAAKQLLAVINDVLDMSSIEAGKLTLAHAPFDFKQLIHAVTNVYLPQCAQKGLSFETKMLSPVDEWLVGDQLRVNQILFNLLNNAVKFTKDGRIWLSVSQTEVRSDEVVVRMQVSDTGCGMSEGMINRLFTPFEQESSGTAAKYGGSGLGLSIVKNLVNMMNGAIRVESAPGEGSTFTVDIPFERRDITADMQLPAGKRGLRVLAVDDEDTERKYIDVMLSRMGVRHDCAAGGEEALAALKAARAAGDAYQVCLLDWRMPNIDGAQTTRSIREEFGKNVLVIVVSAYEHNQASEEARAAGANMFIPKPLFQSALFDLFMTLTGGRLGGAESPEAEAAADFAGRRVLLAEDNAMNRMVADAILRRLGIECETAEDGAVAVGKFLLSPAGYYDAILMDIQMPEVDGFEATKRIRASAHPDAADIQIIALTANAFNEDVAKTLSAGMNAHVSKPIELDELSKALEHAFALKEISMNKRNHRPPFGGKEDD